MDRTDSKIDTPVAQAGSGDVHALTAMSADLTAMRTRYGFESPIGQRCSNLLEQIAELATYVRPDWATHPSQTLPYKISEQIKDLAELTGGMQ